MNCNCMHSLRRLAMCREHRQWHSCLVNSQLGTEFSLINLAFACGVTVDRAVRRLPSPVGWRLTVQWGACLRLWCDCWPSSESPALACGWRLTVQSGTCLRLWCDCWPSSEAPALACGVTVLCAVRHMPSPVVYLLIVQWVACPRLWCVLTVLWVVCPRMWCVLIVQWVACPRLWCVLAVLWVVCPRLWCVLTVQWVACPRLWCVLTVLWVDCHRLWFVLTVKWLACPRLCKSDPCNLVANYEKWFRAIAALDHCLTKPGNPWHCSTIRDCGPLPH